jgi:predicted permease
MIRPGVRRLFRLGTRLFRAAYGGGEEPFEQARLSGGPLWYGEDGREAMEVSVSRWLLGVSLVVLLIATANVANLLLARAVRRQRELAVRLALGITRGRLVRLLLAQSLLLALLGGAAALAVVPLIAALVRATLLPEVEWTAPLVDGRVAVVAVAMALLTGVVSGLIPALRTSRRDLTAPLRSGGYAGGPAHSRLRNVLAVAQATFSVVLLVGAGLFVRSLAEAQTLDLGVEPDRVLRVSASWPRSQEAWTPDRMEKDRARGARFYDEALDRARRLPGVEHAAIAIGVPFGTRFQVKLRVPGIDELPRLPGGGPYVQAVSPGYFATVGLELVRGRVFEPADRAGSEPVAVVSRTMAETLWPGEEPLGKCLLVGPAEAPRCTRVVGVVEDGHRHALREEPAMQYYIPYGHEESFAGSSLLVRPAGDPRETIEPVRQALLEIDPGVLLSFLAGRRLANLLFQTSPADPLVYGAVVAVLLVAALLACLVPARRATRVDPATALRAQ